MRASTQRGFVIGVTVIALFLGLSAPVQGQSVSYTYDTLNRLIRIDYGNGKVVEYTYDAAGNRLTKNVLQVSDTTPPTTAASPAGGTYNTAQSVTLTCNDGTGWGCDKTYYTTDGTTPTTASPVYSSPIAISATATLKFFSRDRAGNSESVRSQTYTIGIPPTTTASPSGGPYNTPKSVTLTCSDPQGPGCDRIYYTTDGTTPTTASSVYSSPIAISATTILKYFSRDLSGNSEAVKSQTYTIDTTPPTGTITVNGGAGTTTSPTVTLTLSCSDPTGCSQMQFSNDNVNYTAPEAYGATKAWTLAPWDGNETVYVRIRDAAGNWSSVYSHTIVLNNPTPNPAPVRIAGANYATVQDAYDAAQDGALIKCRGITYTESLIIDRNVSVTLAGGYDDGFTTNAGGLTALKGTITTTAGGGTLTIGNFVIQQ